jgi:tetratricopeptide (TPR) repeat protein
MRVGAIAKVRAFAITAMLSLRLPAHEGPEHEIEALTHRMAQQGESADLLLERAIEYRTLGRWADAAKDLQRAVRLEPQDPLLLRELAQAQLREGRTGEALATLRLALRLPGLSDQERAAILLIRSQAHGAAASPAAALKDCDEALRSDPTLVAGYLDRSALQKRLKRSRERVAGLEEGIRRTGAGVLVAERVEALLDAGQWQRALEATRGEIETARLPGTWKIRRARALLGLGRAPEAKIDLREALDEIDRRMPPNGRDPSLLLDRAQAREWLGDTEQALRDYTLAAEMGAGEAAEGAQRRLRASKAPRPALGFRPLRPGD